MIVDVGHFKNRIISTSLLPVEIVISVSFA